MKSDRIKNWPKEERPRERLMAEGSEKLTEVELLAMRPNTWSARRDSINQNTQVPPW